MRRRTRAASALALVFLVVGAPNAQAAPLTAPGTASVRLVGGDEGATPDSLPRWLCDYMPWVCSSR